MIVLDGATRVHRIGGKSLEHLRLTAVEGKLDQPGISVLLGGDSTNAARDMLRVFHDPVRHSRIHALAKRVASSTVELVRLAGFDVISDPSRKLPNHGRIVHRQGIAGFQDQALISLAAAFVEVEA